MKNIIVSFKIHLLLLICFSLLITSCSLQRKPEKPFFDANITNIEVVLMPEMRPFMKRAKHEQEKFIEKVISYLKNKGYKASYTTLSKEYSLFVRNVTLVRDIKPKLKNDTDAILVLDVHPSRITEDSSIISMMAFFWLYNKKEEVVLTNYLGDPALAVRKHKSEIVSREGTYTLYEVIFSQTRDEYFNAIIKQLFQYLPSKNDA